MPDVYIDANVTVHVQMGPTAGNASSYLQSYILKGNLAL